MPDVAGTKRKWDGNLDFVPTISDSDDIPDLDAEGEDEDSDAAAGAEGPARLNKKSRKKSKQQQPTVTAIESKPKKKKRKKQESSSEDEEEQDIRWTSKGQDDGAFDPDFEFQDFGDGALTEGFDGWTLPASNGIGKGGVSRGADVDEIIRRRRARDEKPMTNGKIEDDPEMEAQDLGNDEEINGIDHGDDELLAEDAFGMSAPPEDGEADEDDATDHDSQEDSDEEDQANDVEDSESGQDEHEEEDITFPMPEPDDLGNYGGASDEENQDPEVNAKRDAFFAPEEKSLDPKKVSETEASFNSMSLSRPILRGLTAVGFTSPTPIQSKTVPVALMGKDVVGGAETGSGKTAAFILPILERLLYRPKKVPTTRVSVLMPTRELAVQCFSVATKLAHYTDITFALIVGGLSLREQEQTLKKRPDIVIATPGRFIDHMRNSASFAVEHLEILVLDEADRMLEDGFADELNEVLNTIPRSRQTMLFSATMTQDVDKLIRVGLNRPVRLMVDARQQTVSGLVQEFIKLKGAGPEKGEDDKGSHDYRRLATLLQLCRSVYTTQTIVFLPTKSLAHRVKVLFSLNNVAAAELHGSLSQEQRLNAIATFRDGRATHLLATDLASRGLDIPRVETIINYTVPTTRESYLHRVGRTARAGRSGVSCTLFAGEKPTTSTKGKQASERALLRPILRLAKSQKALIRTRTLPAEPLAKLSSKVEAAQEDIDAILKEEKEERLLAQTERDMNKGENMINHEEEILGRPRRTWFQTEKDKLAAKSSGKDVRMGIAQPEESAGAKKQKKKLSGKEKKRLDARDERKENAGWKKRKDERTGGGVLKALKQDKIKKKSKANAANTSKGDKKKSKTKPKGTSAGPGSKMRKR